MKDNMEPEIVKYNGDSEPEFLAFQTARNPAAINFLSQLYDTLPRIKQNELQSIVFDFSEGKHISPMIIAACAQFLLFAKDQCSVNHLPPQFHHPQFLLQQSGLLDALESNNPLPNQSFNSYSNYYRINRDRIDNYIMFLTRHLNVDVPTKDFTGFYSILGEMINNVEDHSQSPDGAIILLNYNYNKAIIQCVIADFGIGIPANINRYFKTVSSVSSYSPVQAFMWALIKNNTTRSYPYNAGKGLDNLVSYIKSVKGALNIYSAEVLYQLSHDFLNHTPHESFRNNPISNFVGTICEISIQTQHLPTKEDDGYDI